MTSKKSSIKSHSNFGPYNHVKQGWATIGNKRHYFRSQLEKDCADYLESLKTLHEIIEWKYEPKIFHFNVISQGTTTYRPDFLVTAKLESLFWIECKGWMDTKSNTKLKRFAKYFPNERMLILRNQNEFHKIGEFDK